MIHDQWQEAYLFNRMPDPDFTSPPRKCAAIMNAAARDGVFILCCVYRLPEPPLMGLESLKMCFSQPGKLGSRENVQGFMHFWCSMGRSGALKRLHDLLRELWNSDESSCHERKKICLLFSVRVRSMQIFLILFFFPPWLIGGWLKAVYFHWVYLSAFLSSCEFQFTPNFAWMWTQS